MSFKQGDIVATNRGGIGIFKGPSKSKPGKVDFFAVNCDSYNGKNFYLNHITEKNLALASEDHPKYKCIACIMGIAWSKKPSKDTLNAFKNANPNVLIKTEADGYREQMEEDLKNGEKFSEEDMKWFLKNKK